MGDLCDTTRSSVKWLITPCDNIHKILSLDILLCPITGVSKDICLVDGMKNGFLCLIIAVYSKAPIYFHGKVFFIGQRF